MIHACYRYIGKDRDSLKNGKKYNLLVYQFNLFERLFGNYPFSWKVMAYRPFDSHTPVYSYGSMSEFKSEWKRLAQKPRKPIDF
jgi:hypothetical protein